MAQSLRRVGHGLIYAGLTAVAVVMLLPLAWMLSAAFKPLAEVLQVPPTWIPAEPTFGNFVAVFERFPFARYVLNSVLVSAAVVCFVVTTSALAGYALAKFRFTGQKVLFLVFLGSLVVPFQSRMISLYALSLDLHISNTLMGVIFPWVVDAFGIFLMRQYMLTIPDELIHAARIDGASELRIFWSVVLPLTKPALATVAIFSFLGSWEEFLWPLIVTNDDTARTLPVGLQTFSSLYSAQVQYQMAGAVIATLPMIVAFMLFQRQIIAGIALTGLK